MVLCNDKTNGYGPPLPLTQQISLTSDRLQDHFLFYSNLSRHPMPILREPSVSSRHTVVVIDDDEVVLQIVTLGLERAGMSVTGFETAEAALSALEAGLAPSLAIVDISLPGLSGLDLAERLATRHGIPFIMMTAHGDEDAVSRAVSAGALSYLVKPIDMGQLVPAVTAALARAAEIGRLRSESARLEDALNGDRAVSVAVGMLMAFAGLSEQEAFNQLRREARAQRKSLSVYAGEIIEQTSRAGDNDKRA